MLGVILRANPDKAYRYAKRAAKDIFGTLFQEFDEEIKNLPAQKKFELAVGFARATGWGEFEMLSFNTKKYEASFRATKTIESGLKDPGGHELTSGFIAGLGVISFGAEMECSVEEGQGGILLKVERAKE
jgi:hypothetical protein